MKFPTMSEAEVEDLFKKPLLAKLATQNRDGTIRITPLWFERRGNSIFFNTHERTTHIRNIKRNPSSVSVLIDTWEYPYKEIHMIGEAHVNDKAATKEEIGKMYERYLGSYEKAEAYGAQLISFGKRVFVVFEPKKEKMITYDFSKSA